MPTSLLFYIQHSCFHTFGGVYTNVGEKEIRHVCTPVMSDHCSFLGYLRNAFCSQVSYILNRGEGWKRG